MWIESLLKFSSIVFPILSWVFLLVYQILTCSPSSTFFSDEQEIYWIRCSLRLSLDFPWQDDVQQERWKCLTMMITRRRFNIKQNEWQYFFPVAFSSSSSSSQLNITSSFGIWWESLSKEWRFLFPHLPTSVPLFFFILFILLCYYDLNAISSQSHFIPLQIRVFSLRQKIWNIYIFQPWFTCSRILYQFSWLLWLLLLFSYSGSVPKSTFSCLHW